MFFLELGASRDPFSHRDHKGIMLALIQQHVGFDRNSHSLGYSDSISE